MSKTHLVIPDSHAHPDYDNRRADYLSMLIMDIRPDVVINMGDMFDFPSLSSYDKGKKSFNGRSYKKDLEAGLDFDDRIWSGIRRAKKKKPLSFFLEGNHEHRLKKALDMQYQELDGVMGFKDLGLERNYDHVIEYEGQTPGVVDIDGINYAHFFISGIMGRPTGGERPAYSLIAKNHVSCTAAHDHRVDYCSHTSPEGRRINGLLAGVYQDYDSPWAGTINRKWWRGVVVKRNVEGGNYDPQFISIEALRKEYG